MARAEKAREAKKKEINALSYDRWRKNSSLAKRVNKRLYARLNE
jgi:hypothetical protein